MRVLFDVVHPAHAHFYRHMIRDLSTAGDKFLVVARSKDVTLDLLAAWGIPFVAVGRSGPKNTLRQGVELIHRDWSLWKIGRRYRPEVVLTRNPAGIHAARLLGATGVFDTDDGSAAGKLFRLAAPLAHVITTPDCAAEIYGPKHIKYPGYKTLAYLHPNRFQPDPGVFDRLGLPVGGRFAIVRFVAMWATHDVGETGLSPEQRIGLVRDLQEICPVFICSESALPPELEPLRIKIAPVELHDALAFASIYVGDSQTMAIEAAVLGTPTLHCSTWSGRLDTLVELEKRYGLIASFKPTEFDRVREALTRIGTDIHAKQVWSERRTRMLQEKTDVTSWYLRLLEDVRGRRGTTTSSRRT